MYKKNLLAFLPEEIIIYIMYIFLLWPSYISVLKHLSSLCLFLSAHYLYGKSGMKKYIYSLLNAGHFPEAFLEHSYYKMRTKKAEHQVMFHQPALSSFRVCMPWMFSRNKSIVEANLSPLSALYKVLCIHPTFNLMCMHC